MMEAAAVPAVVEAGPSSSTSSQPPVSAARRRNRAHSRSSSSSSKDGADSSTSRKESLGGALARATLGSLAFFFRLPIRLFRPVKLSSWTVLESFAKREQKALSFGYVLRLLRRENNYFIFHLLGPPILFNTLIGFTLFESYSITEARLLRRHRPDLIQGNEGNEGDQGDRMLGAAAKKTTWTPLWIVTVAGAAAGAAQCILSAPLDNVRLVLTSHKQQQQGSRRSRHGRHGTGSSSAARHPAHISWRSIFRAALLPFAPEQTRNKLVKAVRHAKNELRPPSTDAASKAAQYFNKEQRRLWQQRLRRLGGSVHGAGLVMSLFRDAIGFSSFFLIFEVSRRAAHSSSTTIDRSIAWWSTSATLPAQAYDAVRGQSAVSSEKRDVDRDDDDDFYHTQSLRADQSYNASRTKTGRVVAAFVLIVGGAVGAFAYEALGRPFELMRLIIWQGRQQWQKAREAERAKRRAGGGRSLRKARLRASNRRGQTALLSANSSSSRLESLLTLRVANSAGSRISRLQAVLSQSHPPHPLRKTGKRLADVATAKKRSRRGAKTSAAAKAGAGAVKQHAQVSPYPPGALSLLLAHAERTSTLAYTSSSRKFRTAVPSSVLLLHTYFVAPYLATSEVTSYNSGGSSSSSGLARAAAAGTEAVKGENSTTVLGERTRTASPTTRSAAKLLRRWTNSNPVSSTSLFPSTSLASPSYSPPSSTSSGASRARLPLSYLFPRRPREAPGSLGTISQARSWGSGRAAWALRRLASPYGVGFLVFAWMSGDV